MITVEGVYSSADIYAVEEEGASIDDYALAQIKLLCDNEVSRGSVIKVMPDVHPGKVGVIGLTMTVGDKIMPNIVGADIGCGVTIAKLGKIRQEFGKLDRVIREDVPSGFEIRKKPLTAAESFGFERLRCQKHIKMDMALNSLGTLGGGNHFIELDKDDEGNVYLTVHSGSRHLGQEVTEHYLNAGNRGLKEKGIEVPYPLTYLEGSLKEAYLHDIEIIKEYASLNRQLIIRRITKGMKWRPLEFIDCVHNYVDMYHAVPILRKGAISAERGETVIIPINMRDGIILGTGLGNHDWNCSAPHGSGRLLKREDVRKTHTLSEYRKSMEGIYSSCIAADTLDEAPFAYRGIEVMKEAVKATVQIEKILKPIYSFKAGGKGDR